MTRSKFKNNLTGTNGHSKLYISNKTANTKMWAIAQRDGRPVE